MQNPPFTNLIVTYNNREDVPSLLGDLESHAPRSHTIVIDNASADGTAEYVQAGFPRVQLVRNAVNVGYARAVNQGVGLSESDHVFLLNPDIRIASEAVFEALQRCLDLEPQVAVAGPLQFKEGGKRPHLNFTWSYLTGEAFSIYLAHRIGRVPRQTGPIRVTFLNAGCLFVRRSAFEAVGGLDERYFLYGEEPDLFLKLFRHGLECRLVPDVSVLHAREQSLRSLPTTHQWRLRFGGLLNIADALLRGIGNIILDRLTSRKPA